MESGDAKEDHFVGSVNLKQLVSASIIAEMRFAGAIFRYNFVYMRIESAAQILTMHLQGGALDSKEDCHQRNCVTSLQGRSGITFPQFRISCPCRLQTPVA